jgi:hypothetical protein
VSDGVVLPDAFMAYSSERLMLSVDQEKLSTAEESFRRRVKPPACVHTVTVADVDACGGKSHADLPVIDDHVPGDPMLAAHASVDFTAIPGKIERRAVAAMLAEMSTRTYP